ncbi:MULTISPECIES: aldo/keto reductase [Anaerostipes]|uniref:aldo/keto reductase n=1 Tax=Anaerostipes TaxID=207244 RepID=UPI001C1DF81F|nr:MULTISPECIES: aldo/keto reductase [Anaerostipes]MCI5623565.1 aldo/keto reductase [Anaerostipes sp.]
MKIPVRTLENGVEMPYLGFGTWKLKGEKCSEMVAYALKNGYTAVDTAQVYLNEEAVGEGIRQSGKKRNEFFITSKIRNRFQGYDNTMYAVEASLKRFGLEYLDLFLIHWPGEDKYVPTWKALVRMYEEGMIRSIGVSNFYPEHMEQCAQNTGIMPMVNQIEMHPYLMQYEIVDYCRENNVFPVSWSPLSAGGEARRDPKTSAEGHSGHIASGNVMEDPVIRKIAETHKKTPAQIILHWHVQNGFGVVPKSANPGRILQNKDIFDFELTKDEMNQIQELTKKQIRIGDDGRTYRFPLLNEMIEAGNEPEKDRFGNYL